MTIIHGEKGPAYHQCADDESDPLAPNDNEPPYNVQQSRSRYSKFAVYGFAALTILEFFYIIWILHPTNLGTMKSGFVTDFQDAKRSISLIQRRFTNQLRLDKNGSLYMATNPNEIQYTGTPSEGIDKAWGNLLGHRYFHLREDEVQKLRKDNELEAPSPLTKVEGSGRLTGIYAGIDMLHSLHCLNDIRKTLYPEYYTEHELPEEWRQMHYDHCIDQIRQAIMCAGDLTPLTMRKFQLKLNGTFHYAVVGETGRKHTCRDASLIREWVRKRAEGSGKLRV